MDFIFEDDVDEVGSDIEAYCPKCKQDTSHTVITKYEEEVRRVQCSVCGDVHAYRKPRGEEVDEPPEPVAARKRAAQKKLTWQEAFDKLGANKAHDRSRPYTIREQYHEGDIVSHPKFGIGFVTEISENKAEVTFQDDRRLLVHNRPDLAAAMPAIAPTPAPRHERGKDKKKKGAAAQAAHAHAHAPAPAAKKGAPPPTLEKKGAKKPEPAPVVKAATGQKVARAKAAATKKSAAKGKPPMKPARPVEKGAKAEKSPPRKPMRAARPARPVVKAKVKKKAKAR
jgi:hypothetical protein